MPEAPEVRRFADELAAELSGKKVVDLSARTKQARAWLTDHPDELKDKTIERIFAHGKNIIGLLQGNLYFYSHQMMWGRWEVRQGNDEIPRDRRERARIEVDGATAILMSAPIFELGVGDPLKELPLLKALGPYVLPYKGEFDKAEFQRRLLHEENQERTIGDALLDQQIVSGLGNYLRAEIMFLAKINPWRLIGELKQGELHVLTELVPRISKQAYETDGVTVTPQLKERLASDPSLVYVPGKEYGTHHYVFRRTNLPCLFCANPIKQLRQLVTRKDDPNVEGELLEEEEEELYSRIVYFCPNCQKVDLTKIAKVRAKSAGKAIKNKNPETMTNTETEATIETKAPTKSQSESRISEKILELLNERSSGKSICPSDVARALEPDEWRELMPKIRTVTDKLKKKKNLIEITQKEQTIDSASDAVGPIRLRLKGSNETISGAKTGSTSGTKSNTKSGANTSSKTAPGKTKRASKKGTKNG